MPLLTIAGLTIKEASRRKLLLALVLLTLLAVAVTGYGFSRIPLIGGRGGTLSQLEVFVASSQLLILVMFMFSFVLAISAVFMASPAVSGDVETGIALAMLARPIRRSDLILGKWLGFALLVFIYAVAATAAELVAVELGTGYRPPDPVGLILFLFAEGLVLLTLGIAFSTRLSGMVGGVIALVLFGIAWLGGIVGGFGTALGNPTVAQIGTITKLLLPSDGLWRGAVFSLEPAFAVIAIGGGRNSPAAAANPFFAAAPPPTEYLVWCAGWIAVVLGLAVWSFRRREL